MFLGLCELPDKLAWKELRPSVALCPASGLGRSCSRQAAPPCDADALKQAVEARTHGPASKSGRKKVQGFDSSRIVVQQRAVLTVFGRGEAAEKASAAAQSAAQEARAALDAQTAASAVQTKAAQEPKPDPKAEAVTADLDDVAAAARGL